MAGYNNDANFFPAVDEISLISSTLTSSISPYRWNLLGGQQFEASDLGWAIDLLYHISGSLHLSEVGLIEGRGNHERPAPDR